MRIKRIFSAIILKARESVDHAHPASSHAGCVNSVAAVSIHVINVHSHSLVEVIKCFFVVAGLSGHNAHDAVRKRRVARGVFFVKVKVPDFFGKSKTPAKQELSQNQIRLLKDTMTVNYERMIMKQKRII